jgi:hypothetical protein
MAQESIPVLLIGGFMTPGDAWIFGFFCGVIAAFAAVYIFGTHFMEKYQVSIYEKEDEY